MTASGSRGADVMLVVTDRASGEDVQAALSRAGMVCLLFTDALEALQHVFAHPPRLVLIDQASPKLAGTEFIGEIKRSYGDTGPILMLMSEEDSPELIEQAFEAGATDFLVTPLSLSVLTVKLRRLLETKPAVSPRARVHEKLGRYVITGELGRGGSGVVYRAERPEDHVEVAIKALLAEPADMDAMLRFRREIDLLTTLNHPNLVTVLETGREDSTFYYVMELIDGYNLQEHTHYHGPFAPIMLARLLFQLAGALDHIHSHGLVHRDIKPSNILISKTRGPVITDFGHSKKFRDNQLTASDHVVGTPHFMSPEMIYGENVDTRADLFSLGLVALEALRGKPLITGTNSFQVMSQIGEGNFPHCGDILRERKITAPAALCLALDKLVALDANERFQRASELRAALAPLLSGPTTPPTSRRLPSES